ncbi:MAG: hypothetical protein ACOC3T_02685 [Bacteroidota bacterium]
MDRYYINTQAAEDGVHEVHREGCERMPDLTFARYLGDYPHCHDAIEDAQDYYTSTNGCFSCCRECNNR